MKKLQNYIRNLSFTERSVPLGLLLTCVIGFGLLIPSLGFYMDDWPYVFYSYNNGTAGLKEMLEVTHHARTVPQILIDGRPIGGFTELTELHMDGGLDELMPKGD